MKILDTIKKLISKESDGKDLESPKYFPNPANPAESISSADTNEKTRDKWERAFAPVKCKAPDILISAHFNGKHFLGIHINLIRGSFLVDALTEKGNKGYLELSDLNKEEKVFLINELLTKLRTETVIFALDSLHQSIEQSNKEEAYFDTLRSKYSSQPIKENKVIKATMFESIEDAIEYVKKEPTNKIVEQLGVEFIELNKQYESFFYTYIAAISKIRIVRVKNKIEDYLSIVDLTNLEIYFLMDELRKKEQTIQVKHVLSELNRELMVRIEVKDGDTIKINKMFKGITYKQIVLFKNRLEVEILEGKTQCATALNQLEDYEKEFLMGELHKKKYTTHIAHAIHLLRQPTPVNIMTFNKESTKEFNPENISYKHHIKQPISLNIKLDNELTIESIQEDSVTFKWPNGNKVLKQFTELQPWVQNKILLELSLYGKEEIKAFARDLRKLMKRDSINLTEEGKESNKYYPKFNKHQYIIDELSKELPHVDDTNDSTNETVDSTDTRNSMELDNEQEKPVYDLLVDEGANKQSNEFNQVPEEQSEITKEHFGTTNEQTYKVTKELNNLATDTHFDATNEPNLATKEPSQAFNEQNTQALNEQETVKETVSPSKKESNYLDFKFEAYCEFRSKTLEKETMTLLELAEALSILYGNSVSDWDLNSLSDLYSSTVESINSYEPTDVLTWKDYKVIPPSVKPMTVGEAITLLEFDRVAKKKLDNDYNANIDFNLGLEQLAVIMRKEGEQLPIDPAERTLFIDQRKKEVSSAPLWLVLNIRFFFIKKYQPFLISQSINTYLTTKSPAKTNSKKPRSPKRKQKGTAGI